MTLLNSLISFIPLANHSINAILSFETDDVPFSHGVWDGIH